MNNAANASLSLRQLFQDFKPTPAGYMKAERDIAANALGKLLPLNVGVASTFTMDSIKPYLAVESARRGIEANIYVAPFNQLEQQFLDPKSSFYSFGPDITVIASRLEDFAPDLTERFLVLSEEEIKNQTARILNRVKNWIQALRRYSRAPILLFNFAQPSLLQAGIADSHLKQSQTSLIQELNQKLAFLCRRHSDLYIFDYARIFQEAGLRSQDLRLWFMGRIPWGAETQILIGKMLSRYIRALRLPRCKCLVLDLDNTLWGGILGETGIGRIAIGNDYPGNIYKEFQKYLLSLRDRGILLAIASKNNESEVLEVFNNHSDMVLKLDDFAARQIHWKDKATSLAKIAAELNIGTDALAFFDDSPIEREWVRSQRSETTIIEVPDNPMEYIRAIEESGVFDQLVLSEEDLKRVDFYKTDKRRETLQIQTGSLDDFLKQLNIEVTIGCIDQGTIPRVAQLFAKTNQFIMTGTRYTEIQLREMLDSRMKGYFSFWLRAQDQFGDYGLIGAAVIREEDSSTGMWLIDNLLLSCRVLGRKIETAFLSMIVEFIKSRKGKILKGLFQKTPKNAPAQNFYAAHGFDRKTEYWEKNISKLGITPPRYMKVRFKNAKHG